MRLFINCSNLRFGGGKTVGHNIIKTLSAHDEIESLVVIAPSNCGYEKFASSKVIVRVVSSIYNNAIFKLILNYLALPLILRRYTVDCILSLGNIAFPSGSVPQILLIHNSYLVYPESIVWKRLNLKFRILFRSMVLLISTSLKYADSYLVQTHTMKKRLCGLFHIPDAKVYILPNAISYTSISEKKDVRYDMGFSAQNKFRLLFLSKLYPHKNFDILFELARKIIALKLPIVITLTLEATENSETASFLNRIEKENLDGVLCNMGHVDMNKISSVYQNHHGLFLPTLLESFSGTYIESMYFRRPIFTSDMDFAREVCRDAAFYFDPHKVDCIISVFQYVLKEPVRLTEKIKFGEKYLLSSGNWDISGNIIIDKVKSLLING